MTRVGTLQFMRSVGQARMRWLGIEEGHHSLSHEPDKNIFAQKKLKKINIWFAQQLAYLAGKLKATPEPGGNGNMLDNTTIVWVNELGKGNSYTLHNIPCVVIGGGSGFKTNRLVDLPKGTPHNRFFVSLANSYGVGINSFGEKHLSAKGALDLG